MIDINIQTLLTPNVLNSQYYQNSIFFGGKHIFHNSLINSLIRANWISHSLYVKFEMWTALFYVNYLSYSQQSNLDKNINIPNSSIDSTLGIFECWF